MMWYGYFGHPFCFNLLFSGSFILIRLYSKLVTNRREQMSGIVCRPVLLLLPSVNLALLLKACCVK